MKNVIRCSLALFFLFGFSACSNANDEKNESNSPVVHIPTPPSSFVVGTEETPADFLTNFYFVSGKGCPDPWYQYAGALNVSLGSDEQGRGLYADLQISIEPKGKFTAYYTEIALSFWPGGMPVKELKVEKFKGRWRIAGKQIVFKGLGTATPYIDRERRNLLLQIERDVIHQGFKGKLVRISRITSNAAIIPDLYNCARR